MEAYQIEVERAWNSLLWDLGRGYTVIEAIGKVRNGYGQSLANTTQDKITEVLLAPTTSHTCERKEDVEKIHLENLLYDIASGHDLADVVRCARNRLSEIKQSAKNAHSTNSEIPNKGTEQKA